MRCSLKWGVLMRSSYDTTNRRLERKCFWILEHATVLRCRLRWDNFSKCLVQIYLIDLVGLAILYFTFQRGGAWSINHKILIVPIKKRFFWTQSWWNLFSSLSAYILLFSNFHRHLNFKLFSKSSLTLSSLVFIINFPKTAIRAKVLRGFRPEISESDDPWSAGPASYTVKVLKTFKGSLHENEITRLETPANEGLCGVHLNVNGEYLLTGRKSFGPLEIMLCDWFEPWSKKTFKQIRKFSKKC